MARGTICLVLAAAVVLLQRALPSAFVPPAGAGLRAPPSAALPGAAARVEARAAEAGPRLAAAAPRGSPLAASAVATLLVAAAVAGGQRAARRNLIVRRLRLVGKEIPRNKEIAYALISSVFGIGKPTAFKILKDSSIDPHKKTFELSEEEELRLAEVMGKYTLENPLRRMYKANCQLLLEIKHRRGVRMQKGLPVRHQRSKTNNRTARKLNPWRV